MVISSDQENRINRDFELEPLDWRRESTSPDKPLRAIVKAYEPLDSIPKPEKSFEALKKIMQLGIYPMYLAREDYLNGLLVDFSDARNTSQDFSGPFPLAPSGTGFDNPELVLDAFQDVLDKLKVSHVRAYGPLLPTEKKRREQFESKKKELSDSIEDAMHGPWDRFVKGD